MALFSRRKKTVDDGDADKDAAATPDQADIAAVADAPAEPAVIPTDPATDAAASVGISVSSYRGLGARSAAQPEPVDQAAAPIARRAAEAPSATETIPGLRDNVVVREALAQLPSPPTPEDILEVMRQTMQGHLFLRVQGDARTLLSEGKALPLAVATANEKQFVLAYSSGAALRDGIRADQVTDTSAMGQPVLTVIRHVLAGPYAGLILDNSSAPARAVLPRELLEKVSAQADPSLEVKTLLAGERTQATSAAVVDALARVKFWVAVRRSDDGRFGVAEARTDGGDRLIELYSHPLEVASLRRGDQAAPMTAAQLAAALRTDQGISGAIVDSGGPWIRLSRDDLAPILALTA